MRRMSLAVFVTIVLVIPALAIGGGDVPNLKGTWTGKSSAIKHEKGDSKPQRSEKDVGKVTNWILL